MAVKKPTPKTASCENLDEAISDYTNNLGYRLDMIVPADAPREALLSREGETVRLFLSPRSRVSGPRSKGDEDLEPETLDLGATSSREWIPGRAGMEYRDLIPGRMGGKIVASHIRLSTGGEVPDYVHYHKIDFQMIYCKRGRIRVMYEDQGPPFWLETGDCVLQPPEIRHRVLECTAGAEVIEVSMPAEHETWVEHEIELPTGEHKPDRDFSGQRFVHHIAANAEWTTDEIVELRKRDTGISLATNKKAYACVIRTSNGAEIAGENDHMLSLCFRLSEDEYLTVIITK